ncbi:hypothetical protein MLD38_038526 [Melastoma candidum]|uniref:Uncharacterized protein n=1 Tax=Melastoma candidum TaxID=119954 RepID=A0ACB9L020_9MYRT|nr:hypothetical protein MLD38_038526 [Melastoma candidum]
MGKELSPQSARRSARLCSAAKHSNENDAVGKEPSGSCCPSICDLVYGEEPISFDHLLSSFPGRSSQIRGVLQLLGPPNSPMLPVLIYGGPSTGKTSIILQLFRHLSRPFVYTSCRTCYSPRVLFESILNQLSLHRPNEDNGYSSAKRCEKPSEFINLLRDASVGLVKSLKDKTVYSKTKLSGVIDGNMVYLVIDNIDLVLEWDKSSSILPFLFSLYDLLKVPELGLIFISSVSPDMFHSATGSLEPLSIYFPTYSDEDMRQILMRDQSNRKLYSSFLDAVLGPFCRITRRLDELSTVFATLFTQYCKPLGDKQAVPNEDMKRRLFSHLQPHISHCLSETFQITEKVPLEAETSKTSGLKRGRKMLGSSDHSNELDFHMCTSARYLLISAFLASRNPATLDASLFDSYGGSDGRKKRRKISEKSKGLKEAEEEESLMKGPGSFPLERLIAIFQCLTSVAEDPFEEQEDPEGSLSVQSGSSALASTLLLQLSSLCNSNFIVKGGSCPLEGSTRYRSMVSEDLALKVAKSINFPLAKYIYRG